MISRSAILKITTPEEMMNQFEELDTHIETVLEPLREKLAMMTSGLGNAQLMNHLTFVESKRDMVSRFYSIIYAFVEHSRSSTFLPETPENGKLSVAVREAHQKQISAGFSSLLKDLEEMLKSIDSRVMLLKKMLDVEIRGLNPKV